MGGVGGAVPFTRRLHTSKGMLEPKPRVPLRVPCSVRCTSSVQQAKTVPGCAHVIVSLTHARCEYYSHPPSSYRQNKLGSKETNTLHLASAGSPHSSWEATGLALVVTMQVLIRCVSHHSSHLVPHMLSTDLAASKVAGEDDNS